MPTGHRISKDVQKSLKGAANLKGQLSITHMFQQFNTSGKSHSDVSVSPDLPSTSIQTSSSACSNVVVSDDLPSTSIQTSSSTCSNVDSSSTDNNNELQSDVPTTEQCVYREADFTDEDRRSSEREGRFCQATWFREYDWLIYSRATKSLYCSTCTKFAVDKNGVFVLSSGVVGFCKWKNAANKLRKHSLSDSHIKSSMSKMRTKDDTIDTRLSRQHANDQSLRRDGLIAHLGTLKTLLRQGCPIRGRIDEESNIAQFNMDKAKHSPSLHLFLQDKQYISHSSLQEQEQLIILAARRNLIQDINKADFFSVIADESCDITKREQISISVRWCDADYNIHEDFVGIRHCEEGLTADALLDIIKDTLVRCAFDIHKLTGVAFDGAATMKSIAHKIQEEFGAHVTFIHCLAHCTELILKDAQAASPMILDSIDICQSLYALVGAYPKRVLLFEAIQNDIESDNTSALRLQSLSSTRWLSRGNAAYVILKTTRALSETLDILSKDRSCTSDVRCKARGLRASISNPAVIFRLVTTHELVQVLENLSKQLQAADLTADVAHFCEQTLILRLKSLRSQEEFQRLHEKALQIIKNDESDGQPLKKRRQTLSTKYDSSIVSSTLGHRVSDDENDLLREYYEAIDSISNSFGQRFHQSSLEQLRAVESLLLLAANNACSDEINDSIVNLIPYKKLFDMDIVNKELCQLHSVIDMYNNSDNIRIKKCTKVSTIHEVFNKIGPTKQCLPQLHRLLQLYVSIAMSSSTAERTFSVMRRLLNYTRAKSSGNHLNNMMFGNIHKKRLDDVDLRKVAAEFCSSSDRLRLRFGTF